jgi:hypothetical protein
MNRTAILLVFIVMNGCSSAPNSKVAHSTTSVTPEHDSTINGVFEGEDIETALAKFRDDYFKDQNGPVKLPRNGFTLISKTEQEARVRFYVYYALWLHEEDLILGKKEEKWLIIRREKIQDLNF